MDNKKNTKVKISKKDTELVYKIALEIGLWAIGQPLE
jgi:hypothetical protein